MSITVTSSKLEDRGTWARSKAFGAELERTGHEFLEEDGDDARAYLATVGQSLLRRHLAVVGSSEQRKPLYASPRPKAGSREFCL